MTDVRVTRAATEVVTNLTTTPEARVTRIAVEVLTDHSGVAFVEPTSIVSGEAFGTPSLLPFLIPIGIASEEAFGDLNVSSNIKDVTSIVSEEAFGTPSLAVLEERVTSWLVDTPLFGTNAIFPLEAIVPCTEKISWLTDAMVSYDGTEKRLRVRAEPRTTMQFKYSEGIDQLAIATLNQYMALQENWIVPLWTESQAGFAISATDTLITIDTTDLDYRDDSLALIYESPTLWEIVEIQTVAASSLTLYAGVERTYTAAKVMPARLGVISGNISMTSTGYSAIATLNYNLTDNLALTEADDPDQFEGDDIYYEEGLTGDGSNTFAKTISTRIEDIDFDLGQLDRLTPWTFNQTTVKARYSYQGKEDIRAFKRLLERRAGKFNQFWEPTFEADLTSASSGTLTTTLRVLHTGQLDWDLRRTHIAIYDTQGNWTPCTILSISQATATEIDLLLDTDLSMEASDISYISYLGLKRFASDSIELSWIGNITVEATINILEISS